MRKAWRLLLWTGIIATKLSASTVLLYEITGLGGNQYRYDYLLSRSSIVFQRYQELDIRFDPDLYGMLSSPVAGPAFSLEPLKQPNNPYGTFGDYSITTASDNPSLVGEFSVQFVFLGAGEPGAQPFFINQYDSGGNYLATPLAGVTTGVPEPGTLGMFVCGTAFLLRRIARCRNRHHQNGPF